VAQTKCYQNFTDSPFPPGNIQEDREPNSNLSVGANSRTDVTSMQPDTAARRPQRTDSSQALHSDSEEAGPEIQDPLSHMSDIDRWGLKGWSFMMNNFPDYSALVNGSNITNLGFDLNSSE
jgi:CCR4-NOT transcription complex subunit 2